MNKAAATLTNLASFPSNFGTLQNRFTNQNLELNNDGYGSKEILSHFADTQIHNNKEQYCKECIGVGGGEAAVAVAAVKPAAAAATAQLDVMQLSVTQLKAELRKRGRGTSRNKSVLQVRLKEASASMCRFLKRWGGTRPLVRTAWRG